MSWRDGRPLRIASLAVLLWALGQYPLGVSVAAADEPDEQLLPSYEPATQPSVVKPGSSSADRRPPIVRKPAKAPDEHEEHVEHEPHLKNNIGLGFAYSAQWLHEETEGEHPNNPTSLYGFSIFYERVLIPGHLALSLRKPFVFDGTRFDSPLSVALEGLWERKHWELFIGTGVRLNLRVFETEQEGVNKGFYASFAIPVMAGVNLLLTRHWSVQTEGCYNWIASDDPVNFEVEAFLTALYHF
jgi:hypothetical protein